jgi:hypothetical protein
MMFVRVFIGVGLLALGYFVGREVGRTESVREELERRRAGAGTEQPDQGDSGPDASKHFTDPSPTA